MIVNQDNVGTGISNEAPSRILDLSVMYLLVNCFDTIMEAINKYKKIRVVRRGSPTGHHSRMG